MYLLAYILGFQISKLRIKQGLLKLSFENLESYVSYLIIGMLLGARIFYVIFYNFSYYKENISEILFIHHGGLSFHGAVVGMVVATYIFCKKKNVAFFSMTDTLAYGAVPGLFFGRLGNFINGELYGRATDVPWAMIFPNDSFALPRHPSQIYESLSEGLILFSLLYLWQKWRIKKQQLREGEVGALFLIGYAVFRFFIEYTREPDEQLGLIWASLSMGQILCIVMALCGFFVLKFSLTKAPLQFSRS
jgi:phosphatidylglycerol:prolipoprotein diacylglycerol transferase